MARIYSSPIECDFSLFLYIPKSIDYRSLVPNQLSLSRLTQSTTISQFLTYAVIFITPPSSLSPVFFILFNFLLKLSSIIPYLLLQEFIYLHIPSRLPIVTIIL